MHWEFEGQVGASKGGIKIVRNNGYLALFSHFWNNSKHKFRVFYAGIV